MGYLEQLCEFRMFARLIQGLLEHRVNPLSLTIRMMARVARRLARMADLTTERYLVS